MKHALIIPCLCVAAFATAAEPAGPSDQQLLTVIKEIQTQQAAIAENQTKIDAKVALIAEAVRVARIYSSRSGQ